MSARSERLDRSIRLYAITLPLEKRQEFARQLGHPDGQPMQPEEIRQYIRQARGTGESRRETRGSLIVIDQMERRIGSLNPEEIDALLAEEWPVTS
jgi:hypothetical protein